MTYTVSSGTLNPSIPYYCSVNGKGLGVQDGKTSGYFLTSVASGYFRFVRDYVLTSDVGNCSSGHQNLPHKSLPIFLFPVGILLPVV